MYACIFQGTAVFWEHHAMYYNTVDRHKNIREIKFFNINIARNWTNLFLCPVVTDGIVCHFFHRLQYLNILSQTTIS